MKKIIILFFLLAAVTASADDLKGKVTDKNKQPLIGASIWWEGTNVGTSTDVEGSFQLHRIKGRNKLIASYVGYLNDTLTVAGNDAVEFLLENDGVGIEDVVVNSTLGGNYIKSGGLLKDENISFAGLCKMACCNLAESFENSASVTVGYSDAISGARQIKMLGLAGTYTQILDENRPIMRGLSAPYGLSYTPGMWLNSIQVSKGVASVAAGHEAITGQINLEHRKPTDEERLFVNLYIDDELRPEANISTALPVTKDGKLSTVLLLHGSGDTDVRTMDHNHDGFRDLPLSNQINVANRWLYTSDKGLQVRWGAKFVSENRLGGMVDFKKGMRDEMVEKQLYGSQIHNRGANAYLKIGCPVGAAVYDEEEEDEMRSNVAAVIDFDYFNEDAYFGLNDYQGEEKTLSVNFLYAHYFTYRSSLNMGLSGRLQYMDERLLNGQPGTAGKSFNLDRREAEAGLFAEYTYTIKDKFSLVAGLRGDYFRYYRDFRLTPRGHIKWNITPSTVLRASAGLGYRSTNIITDNIGMLATGRTIGFVNAADMLPMTGYSKDFDRLEHALTVGGSLTQTFGLLNRDDATLSFDWFRTQFYNGVVIDQEYDTSNILVYNTDGRSYTDTYQVDFSWHPAERLDIFATFRYTDSEMTVRRPGGQWAQVERPLVSEYKGLLNVQYATKFRKWTFDATAQINGPCRLPSQTGDLKDSKHSPAYPMFFAQVTRKLGRFDLYVGCENIGDYMQKDPILVDGKKFQHGMNPFQPGFNSSVVWGPLMGRKFYFGLRFTLY